MGKSLLKEKNIKELFKYGELSLVTTVQNEITVEDHLIGKTYYLNKDNLSQRVDDENIFYLMITNTLASNIDLGSKLVFILMLKESVAIDLSFDDFVNGDFHARSRIGYQLNSNSWLYSYNLLSTIFDYDVFEYVYNNKDKIENSLSLIGNSNFDRFINYYETKKMLQYCTANYNTIENVSGQSKALLMGCLNSTQNV